MDDDDAAIAGLSDGSIIEEDPDANPLVTNARTHRHARAWRLARQARVREVIQQSSEANLPVLIEGSGIARRQSPRPGAILPDGAKIKVQFRR